mmetsp:Transcript_67899/g.196554  ORF Transcript_67899/g.196554 Transcript_67899/m.196554 type:complete len:246 (-) Transcript_67899:870-1607(-)
MNCLIVFQKVMNVQGGLVGGRRWLALVFHFHLPSRQLQAHQTQRIIAETFQFRNWNRSVQLQITSKFLVSIRPFQTRLFQKFHLMFDGVFRRSRLGEVGLLRMNKLGQTCHQQICHFNMRRTMLFSNNLANIFIQDVGGRTKLDQDCQHSNHTIVVLEELVRVGLLSQFSGLEAALHVGCQLSYHGDGVLVSPQHQTRDSSMIDQGDAGGDNRMHNLFKGLGLVGSRIFVFHHLRLSQLDHLLAL